MSALAGDDAIFRIKHVSYRGKAVPILMQNLNGPCPLLAISNALLLQQKIAIHQDLAYIDFRQLIHLVGDYLVQSNPPHPDPDMQANQQQQIADALAVLPKLGRGLDVNVRFQKVTDFEYTDELSVVDMLGMNLVHGWLCDPQDKRTAAVIKDMSYNQLICLLVEADDVAQPAAAPPAISDANSGSAGMKWSSLPSVVTWNMSGCGGVSEDKAEEEGARAPGGAEAGEKPDGNASGKVEGAMSEGARAERLMKASVAEEFLQDTASQLTYFGLEQLHAGVREGELCVFFRNNHFCTLCRYDGELYLLVTDVGFYDQPNIVWEKLADVSGDNAFFNSNFSVYNPKSTPKKAPMSVSPSKAAGGVAQGEPLSMDHVQNALSAIASVPGNMIKDAGAALEAVAAPAPSSSSGAVHSNVPASGEGGGAHSKEQEDADMALALSLQAEWEEEERRAEQRRMEQQQQASLAEQQRRQTAPGRPATQSVPGGARAPASTGGAAARQRAGAQGGVAAEQMRLYQLAQQERHVEARTREQQQPPRHTNQQLQGQAQQQQRTPGRPPQMPEEEYRRRLAAAKKEGKSKKDCVVQ